MEVKFFLSDRAVTSRSNSSTFSRGFLQDVHIQIAQNKKLKDLLDEVDEIRALINLIAQNIAIVKDLQNNILSHTNKDLQRELEARTCTISQTAFHVQRKLRDLGKDIGNNDDLIISSAKHGSVHTRIKVLQCATMARLYSDIMEDYNTSILRYHDNCLSLLKRQRSLIRGQITSQELDHMLDAEETSLFVDNILEDSNITKQQLSDIESRHNEVLKLEKSVTEIRDLLAEMAILIEKQGEQIDNVEYFSNRTANNIDAGRIIIRKTERLKNLYRKRKIKIIIIISVILIILFLFVYISS